MSKTVKYDSVFNFIYKFRNWTVMLERKTNEERGFS